MVIVSFAFKLLCGHSNQHQLKLYLFDFAAVCEYKITALPSGKTQTPENLCEPV